MTFSITAGSPVLNAVEVLRALHQHAINPSSVASGIWGVFSPYFKEVIDDLQSVFVDKVAVGNRLLTMGEKELNELTERMISHAKDWVTMFLLPSMLFFPAPL